MRIAGGALLILGCFAALPADAAGGGKGGGKKVETRVFEMRT